MSKVMHITSYCDNRTRHGDTQVPAPHEDLVGSVGSTGQRRLDLCDQCFGSVFEPFVVLLANGQADDEGDQDTQGRRAASDLPRLCPECGKVSKSRPGLGQHMASEHGKRFGAYPNRLQNMRDYEGLPHHY